MCGAPRTVIDSTECFNALTAASTDGGTAEPTGVTGVIAPPPPTTFGPNDAVTALPVNLSFSLNDVVADVVVIDENDADCCCFTLLLVSTLVEVCKAVTACVVFVTIVFFSTFDGGCGNGNVPVEDAASNGHDITTDFASPRKCCSTDCNVAWQRAKRVNRMAPAEVVVGVVCPLMSAVEEEVSPEDGVKEGRPLIPLLLSTLGSGNEE